MHNCLLLKLVDFVLYVYRHLTSKNAKGITGGLAYFRKRTCSRKEIRQYIGKPEERGLLLVRWGFVGFRLKTIALSIPITNIITINTG